jgi:hypothetical protein
MFTEYDDEDKQKKIGLPNPWRQKADGKII